MNSTKTLKTSLDANRNKSTISYKDLNIYVLSHDLAIRIHEMTINLPKFEMYEEGSQIRRSAKAISANIVEGFGRRRYKKEFIRFMVYAHSSSMETIEHLSILFETHSIGKKIYEELKELYERLSKMIYRFILAIEREHRVD